MGKIFISSYWPSFCVLVIGISLRFLYLDSDPQYYAWVGYITDEGRWVQHARSLALHGTFLENNMRVHFYLAPIYQLAHYLMFELAGVSLLTSRMLAAFCGSVVLVLCWANLRNIVSSQALFLGVTLLAFQLDILALSRIGVPEMAAILMQLLIYFQIVKSKQSPWRIAMAGCLMLLAVGVKATTALLLPIFSLVILFMPRHPNEVQRWRGLMLFWAGLLLPMLLVSVVWRIYSPEQSALFVAGLIDLWNGALRQYFRLSSGYSVMSFPFVDTFSLTFNLWMLGLWLSALGWMAADRNSIDLESRRYLVTAIVWVSSYFVLMLAIEYFPTRYMIHILMPMSLCLMVGMSLLQRLGLQAVIQTFGKVDGAIAVLWLSFLCLPTAVVLSPLAASAIGYFAVDPERLSIKLASVILLWAGTTYVAGRCKQNHWAMGFLLMFPLIAGMVWGILSILMNGYLFWPSASSRSHFALYGLVVLIVSGISLAVGQVTKRWGIPSCARLITAFAMFFLPISMLRIASGYIHPQYSMRDTSRDLGKILAGYSTIGAMKTEGLFNENDLPYMSIWSVKSPDIVVLAFRDVERMVHIKQNYHLMKSYNIFVSPDYDDAGRNPVRYPSERVAVSVYQKNGTGRE